MILILENQGYKRICLPREYILGVDSRKQLLRITIIVCYIIKNENEMYADLDEILQWAENNYIDVYMPIISRKEYKMMDRALRLI